MNPAKYTGTFNTINDVLTPKDFDDDDGIRAAIASGSWSVAFWLRLPAANTELRYMMRAALGLGNGMSAVVYPVGDLVFSIFSLDGNSTHKFDGRVTGYSNSFPSSWVQCVLTVDNGNGKLYFNNQEVVDSRGSQYNMNGFFASGLVKKDYSISWGGNAATTDTYATFPGTVTGLLEGQMTNFEFWKKAMTTTEIATHYALKGDKTAPVLNPADLTFTKTQTSITISGLQSAFTESSSITDVKIYYSSAVATPTDYVSATSLDSVTISNLQPNTPYYLYYIATDEYGNTNEDITFFGTPRTEIGPDTIGPNLSSLAISNITSSTFDIVNFDLVTDDRDTNPLFNVYWSLTNTQPATTTKFFNLNYAKSNTIQVDGLTNGKKYYVWVVGEDATGNKTTKELEATTLDNEGPTGTTNLAVGGATATSIDVTGFNLVDDNVKVTEFDIYYATSTTKPTAANVTLTKTDAGSKYTITGLTASTGYYVWVDSKDAAGNVTVRQVNTTAYSTTAAVTNSPAYKDGSATATTTYPLVTNDVVWRTDLMSMTSAGMTFWCTLKMSSLTNTNLQIQLRNGSSAFGMQFYAPSSGFRVWTNNFTFVTDTWFTPYASSSAEWYYIVRLNQSSGTMVIDILDENKVSKKSVTKTGLTFTIGTTLQGFVQNADTGSTMTISKLNHLSTYVTDLSTL